jgi:alkylation response protein AidB-like acyl-CoA dehydrogenase
MSQGEATLPDLHEFRADARAWLSSVATPRVHGAVEWGVGSDSVVVFDNWSEREEAETVAAGRAWERQRFDAGWGNLTWSAMYGGRGLPARYADAFDEEEDHFVTPRRNELFEVTRLMIAPTIDAWGTDEQRAEFVMALVRTDLLCCQLFSEPGAGSDLAGVATKAVRDGDDWVLDGQKVWTSGARSADWGLAICRTDPDVAKHAGLTAFMVPMDAPGITIRPIKQMSGGASFNEVFLDGVRLNDSLRLGPVGAGWKVALTTLAAERSASNSLGGGSIEQVIALARAMEALDDPIKRAAVADLWIHVQVEALNVARVTQSLSAGQAPGSEGSIGRLSATRNLTRTAEVVSMLLGPKLTADTGEWGTFAWCDHVLGAPGYRIAGGSDEIQHNIIGERVLGLPREPR